MFRNLLKGLWVVLAAASLLSWVAPDASAYYVASDIYYFSGDIGGFGETYRDSFDPTEECVVTVVNESITKSCKEYWVSVGLHVQPPHGSPLLGGNWGWDEAYLDYDLSSPETGDWVQSSDHYLGWDTWLGTSCFPLGEGGNDVECESWVSIGPDWQLLDTLYRFAEVPPPFIPSELTYLYYDPPEVYAPACLGLVFDAEVSYVDFTWVKDDTNESGSEVYWPHDQMACVTAEDVAAFGPYHISVARRSCVMVNGVENCGVPIYPNAPATIYPPANFAVIVSPETSIDEVEYGDSITYTVSINASLGFSQSVALSVGNLPLGATASFNPTQVIPGQQSLMTIATSAVSGAHGVFTLVVTGSAAALVRTASPVLKVTPKIVATATTVWYFGGENPAGWVTSTTLTSSAGGATDWSLAAGTNKVNLSTFAGATTVVTSSGLLFSEGLGDIKIKASVAGTDSKPISLTTRTPHSLRIFRVENRCDFVDSQNRSWKYASYVDYEVLDNLNTRIPSVAIGANEQFLGRENDPAFPMNNWPSPAATHASIDTGALGDTLAISPVGGNPTPSCGTGAGARVFRIGQVWRIGSEVIGNGRAVQSAFLTYYTDFGDVTDIQSPVP